MEKHTEYTFLGLQALQRAAAKVYENAIKNGIKIPIWKDGSIKFEIPPEIAKQTVKRP
ncbi:hypothetical protein MHK_000095 [Candidatus Magnetomorum sp. HK-1]|nr:hypothetical protein MHK_000095 [Candidatus Magnetomorum sp. HK-1]